MPLRTFWKFPYATDEIARSARKQREFHRNEEARLLDLQQELAERRHKQPADTEISTRLAETIALVKHHGDEAEKMERWLRMLDNASARTFDLDYDDVCFFGL